MEPKKMAPEEIAEIRARSPLDPWPANVWEGEMGGWCAVGPHRKRGDEGEDDDCFERAMDDARWIESARTDIPRILSHIDALQAENERLQREASSDEEAEPILCPGCGHDAFEHANDSRIVGCEWSDGEGTICGCRWLLWEILRDAANKVRIAELAKFRELAREATQFINAECGWPAFYFDLPKRLAAHHKESASSLAPQTPPRPS